MARLVYVFTALGAALAIAATPLARGSGAAPPDQGPDASPSGSAPALAAQVPLTIQRTFVSTTGSDANPCTATQPCRGFAVAIANTTAGGEVVALNSGGYGAFSVDKAITIAGAPGAHVAITVPSGVGIFVQAGTGDAVVLRNLYVTGLGGHTGIWFQTGRSLAVENVTVSNFTINGLYANAPAGKLTIRDSVFRQTIDVDAGQASGVYVNGALKVEIEGSRADGNDYGFSLDSGARGSFVDSDSARNNHSGFWIDTGAVLALTDVVADGNEIGVEVVSGATQATLRGATLTNSTADGLSVDAAGAVARIAGSTVTGNAGAGLHNVAGTLETFGDNLVRGNTTELLGTITAVSTSRPAEASSPRGLSPDEPVALPAPPASAAPPALPEARVTIQRTFVSVSGSDANPCTRPDPCRGFDAAIANTTAGGEVVALTSGGYGAFTVPKALTVLGARGAHVAISVASGTGIAVDAGVDDAIVLRNLYVTGLGGTVGIDYAAGKSLIVDGVVASGFTSAGLFADAPDGTLVVRDSIFRDNIDPTSAHAAAGLDVPAALRLEIVDSRADGNDWGFMFEGDATGSVLRTASSNNRAAGFRFGFGPVVALTDVVADGNGSNGVLVIGFVPATGRDVAASGETQVTLRDATLSNNGSAGVFTVGVNPARAGPDAPQVTTPPIARIGGSTVTGNATGLNNNDGILETFGDNLVRGNALFDTFGTTTVGTARSPGSAPESAPVAPAAWSTPDKPQPRAAAPTAPADARATIQRTFVSTSGNDANNCTPAAPCRGFAAAIANTTAGGEVIALDSGGYGPFTVGKAITIAGAPGAHAAVTVMSGTGVVVAAGATDAVVLRNLYVSGLGGDTGISYDSGASLTVEGVTVAGFSLRGLYAQAGGGMLAVRDSSFRQNIQAGGGQAVGVFVQAALRVEIEDTSADANDYGFVLFGARGSVVNSEASASRLMGFWCGEGSVMAMTDVAADGALFGVVAIDGGTELTLRGATLSNNTEAGLVTGGTGLARISASTVTGNGDGLRNVDGTLESFGDNLVRGNTADISGTVTTVSTGRPAESAPARGAAAPEAPTARPPAVHATAAPAAPAEAAATIQRTFVSTSGNDANQCTAAAPCRGFAAAIANTTAGGEVVALDSGGYGAFTVNKAITIAGAPGAHVAVTVFSGTGIEVNAGPTDAVVLRNLYVTGLGGNIGIWYRGGGRLYVEGVTSSGFTFPGGMYANAGGRTLVVRDSVFRDNADPVEGFGSGIFVNASMRVEIADCRADGNDVGFNFNSAGRGAVVRSSATGNTLEGFAASNGALVALTDVVFDGNGFDGAEAFNDGSKATFRGATLSNNPFRGIWSHFGAPLARIAGSTVTANGTGLVQQDAGTIETFQDNLLRGNGAPSSGTITPVAKS